MSNSKKSPNCNLEEATEFKEEMQETVKKKEDSVRPKCKLDSHGCLNLQDVLLMFDSPISQERAWALCYQIAKGLSRLTENKFYEISELWQIVLHKDGDICLESLAGDCFTIKLIINSKITKIKKLITKLKIINKMIYVTGSKLPLVSEEKVNINL